MKSSIGIDSRSVVDAAVDALVRIALRAPSERECDAVNLALADALACMAASLDRDLTSGHVHQVEDLVIAAAALDLDDIDWTTMHHPGSVVIPAALALAREAGCTGEDLRRAIAAGYRVASAVGSMLDPGFRARWHATAICGAFGAAASAALLQGAGEAVLERTFLLVACSVGGLAIAPRARNGAAVFTRVAAASLGKLAASGSYRELQVAPGAISGPGGLAEVLSDQPLRQLEDRGGAEAASLRLFPVTGFAHAAVWTAQTFSGSLSSVKSVDVSLAQASMNMNAQSPWWDIGHAVGQVLVGKNAFTCDGDRPIPLAVRLEGSNLPITQAEIVLEDWEGSLEHLTGDVPGRLNDQESPALFLRKAEEVLHVSGEQAILHASHQLTDGVARNEEFKNILLAIISH